MEGLEDRLARIEQEIQEIKAQQHKAVEELREKLRQGGCRAVGAGTGGRGRGPGRKGERGPGRKGERILSSPSPGPPEGIDNPRDCG